MMKNTNCEQIRIWLIDFVDGNLDQETHTKVYEHIERCEACNQDMEEIKTLFEELSTVKNEVPPGNMKEEFQQMLNTEIAKSETKLKVYDEEGTGSIRILPKISKSWWIQVAAAIVLLIAGALIDRLVLTGKIQTDRSVNALADLENEMQDMKKLLLTSLGSETSPSVRIRAIDSVQFIKEPDSEMIDILFTALNMDQNVNVRFAAAQTLAQYIQSEQIRTGFIESLAIQNEPLIQITLVNLLVRMGETRAVNVIKQLMYNPENPDIVREEAQKGINILES